MSTAEEVHAQVQPEPQSRDVIPTVAGLTELERVLSDASLEEIGAALPGLMAEFESLDPRIRGRIAHLVKHYIETSQLAESDYVELVGSWREDIECLLAQDVAHYETMFLGLDPVTRRPMPELIQWLWGHDGQVAAPGRAILRSLIDRLPDRQIQMCEIGSFIGRGSTRAFLAAFREFDKAATMYCVDPWRPQICRDYFESNVRQFGGEEIVVPVQKTSAEAVQQFADGQFDLVYIDGLHDYENVRRDLELWYPKVRSGGIIAGDDCEGTIEQCIPAYAYQNRHDPADREMHVYDGGKIHVGAHPGVILAVHEFFGGRAVVGTFEEKQWYHCKP